MANNWKINETVDLQRGIDGVKVWPHALLVTGDENAHEWNVTVMDNGKPASLGGSIRAYFVRSDGATVTAVGSVAGNVATVTLPEACYAYEGDLSAVMQLLDGDVSVTLSALLLRVRQISTDIIIDPGTEIPSLDDLLAQIEKLKQATKDTIAAINKANAAASLIENMTVTAHEVEAGGVPTAAITKQDESINIDFGLVKGNDGEKGTTDWNELTGKPEFAKVATSGSYADLSGTEDVATKEYVGERIRGIEIGGVNLFTGSKNFSGNKWHNAGTNIMNFPYDGSYQGLSVIKSTRRYGGVIQDIEIMPGVDYTFSAYIKRTENAYVQIYIDSEDGKVKATAIDTTTDWKRYSYTFKFESENKTILIHPRIENISEGANSTDNVIWACGYKLERGDKATDWTPAPEDTDRAISRRATVTYNYNGRNLKDIFGTPDKLQAALASEDYSQIAVGDYWPITLNGTFWDYGSYTVPQGVDFWQKPDLNEQHESNLGNQYEGKYYSDELVSFYHWSGLEYYARASACLPYFERACTNVTVNLEVAGINHYWRYGNIGELSGKKPHIVFISRDCLPFLMRMRKGDTKWESTEINNPWIGSAMFKTLNDETNGVLPLVAKTDIGAYIYTGPSNQGMRALLDEKAPDSKNATGWGWYDRGKLFLPSATEVWGHPFWAEMNWEGGLGNQFAIFRDSRRHISKGGGDNAGRTGWWLGSSRAGSTAGFAYVGSYGDAGNDAATGTRAATVCFIFA